ncbi:MAG TPA: flagellar basal body rod protein FlgC [Sumerlaeia bacterium]|nr:flagellar basal body rod protein FlgC [Sumerlaeia bacterium]
MYDLIPIEIAASGMEVQRVRMGMIASNLANAHTTRSAEGAGPYQRRILIARATRLPAFEKMLTEANREIAGQGAETGRSRWLFEEHLRGAQVARIERDPAIRMVPDPDHPDADPETGMVAYPDISVIQEMTDSIAAARNYEANLAVVKNTREMLMQMLEMLRR